MIAALATEVARAQPMLGKISAIYRYPVKGLSPQYLQSAELGVGATIAFDRAWAIENGPGRFDENEPKHLPKINFLMLMRNERLASLKTVFSEDDTTLTILRGGKAIAKGNLSMRIGRQLLEQFLSAYMQSDLRGPPKIVSAEGHSFSDVAAKCVHIVNLASVAELARIAGRDIDPLRFRPNIVIDGVPAWSEFDWIDREISIGAVKLRGFDRTMRCAATEVDPKTGARDLSIPTILERSFGHTDFGIYATVSESGAIAVGDSVGVDRSRAGVVS